MARAVFVAALARRWRREGVGGRSGKLLLLVHYRQRVVASVSIAIAAYVLGTRRRRSIFALRAAHHTASTAATLGEGEKVSRERESREIRNEAAHVPADQMEETMMLALFPGGRARSTPPSKWGQREPPCSWSGTRAAVPPGRGLTQGATVAGHHGPGTSWQSP